MLLLVRLINYCGYKKNENRNCLKAEPGYVHVYNQQAESSLSWKEILPEGGRIFRLQLAGGQFPGHHGHHAHAPGHK